MPRAAIFDVDGTLIDSVDLHALAWHEAFAQYGYEVSFEQARSQIGKGGDNLLPAFLSDAQVEKDGEQLEAWRGKHFKANYLELIRPFSAVPDLLQRLSRKGWKIAVASSAKKAELEQYLDVAKITSLVDVKVSSEDVEQSKPAPDVFQVALKKLGVEASDAVAIGDSPYDAEAATKAGLRAIGFLSGAFTEHALLEAGCVELYPGPAGLLASLGHSSVFA